MAITQRLARLFRLHSPSPSPSTLASDVLLPRPPRGRSLLFGLTLPVFLGDMGPNCDNDRTPVDHPTQSSDASDASSSGDSTTPDN